MTMMPSFLPGNLAMMLWMGNLPTGVVAVKASTSTSSPFSLDWMYCSTLTCPGLPAGREPNATISFTYWKARVELTWGAGGVVAGVVWVVAGAGFSGATAAGLASAEFGAVDASGLLQARNPKQARNSTAIAVREGKSRGAVILESL